MLRYEPLAGPSCRAGYNSRAHGYEMARLFPSHWTMSRYCGTGNQAPPGREYLGSFFGRYATSVELTDLEARIIEITGGCSVVPPDDPE